MTADLPRILPVVTPENAHFWRGGEDGALRVLRCGQCRFYIHPPSPVCPSCICTDVAVATLSGDGLVASFTVNHQPWRPGLTVPYVIAVVELAEQEGLRLTTNVVGCEPEAVRIGQPVHVCFERHEDVWLPLFAPRSQ